MIRYIINENATVIFWKNGEKTIARLDPEDKFDKELGFMLACYKYMALYRNSKVYSKSELKKELACIKNSKFYDFLFICFNKYTFNDVNKTKKFLEQLKVEKTKKKAETTKRAFRKVKIKNGGKYYSSFTEFVEKHFPSYVTNFEKNSYNYSFNKTYDLIGTVGDKSLIQDPDTKEVFVFGIEGIGIVKIENEVE